MKPKTRNAPSSDSPAPRPDARSSGRPGVAIAGWLTAILVALLPAARAGEPAPPVEPGARQVVGAEGAYIPAVDSEWEARFEQVAEHLAKNEFRQAIDLLQRAVEFGRRNLIQVSPGGRPLPEERSEAWSLNREADGGADDADASESSGTPESATPESPEVGSLPGNLDELDDDRRKILLEQIRRMQRDHPSRDVFRPGAASAVSAPFRPRFYLPVSEVASRMLESLPAAARELYLSTYEAPARKLLDRALEHGDEADLARLASEYFPTRASTRARVLRGDQLFEAGKIRLALAHWQRSLDGTFSTELPPGDVRIRILLALGRLGLLDRRDELAREFLEEWRVDRQTRENRGETSPWQASFPARVREILALEPASPEGSSSLAVPLAGEAAGQLLAKLPELPGLSGSLRLEWSSPWWSQGVLKPRSTYRVARTARVLTPGGRHHSGEELPYSFFPWIEDGGVFISSVYYNYRVDLQSGNLLRQLPKPFLPLEALKFKESSVSPIYSSVVDDGILYTTTISGLKEMRQYMGYVINEVLPTRSLVAQDQRTGKVLWHTRDFRLGSANDPKPVSFITTPRIVGETVIVGGWINTGHVNSVVVAFDRRTGRPRWNALLASNQMELTMFGEWAREPLGWVILEDEGILYCNTNLGAVAAVDSSDGTILWLRTYPTVEIQPSMGPYPTKRNLSWDINPPLLAGGTLVVTPRDSRQVLALDIDYPLAGRSWNVTHSEEVESDSGSTVLPLVWDYPCPRGARYMLGIHQNRVYFSGPRGLSALEMPGAGSGRTPDLIHSKIDWNRRDPLRGRPALSERGIVFTDATGLRLASFELDRVDDLLSEPFPESQHGSYAGNVALWKGKILIQSREILSCVAPWPAESELEPEPPPRQESL